MKVRIGYALGAVPSLYPQARRELAGLGPVVDDLDRLGFDSLWFPERINSMQLDPIVAMAYVAGRSEHLKFCLLYTSPSPRDQRGSRMPSSA